MSKLTHWTVYRRLVLLGTLPALAMFLLLLWYFTSARLDDTREHLFASSESLLESLAPALEYPVVTGYQELLDGLLEQALASSPAVEIVVRDNSGHLLARATDGESHAEHHLHRFVKAIDPMPVAMETGDMSWLSASDRGNDNDPVGQVELIVSDHSLVATQREILWASSAIGLILFAGTLIFVSRLAYRLSDPMVRLVGEVDALSRGDYEIDPQPTRIARELQELQSAIAALAYRMRYSAEERERTLAEIEKARRKAESANNAKSEFLAMMSHELRTPLNGVLGMIQLLHDEPLSAQQQDYLNTAQHSTEDLLTIITDILDFARIEQGRLAVEHRPFDARALLEQCTAPYRHITEEYRLDYQLRFRGEWAEDPTVLGDPARLRQVITHLIANAIKFTSEGHVIVTAHWARLEEDGVLLTVEIEDSGSGIPPERMSDMFSSFEQLDRSSSRPFGGTGLGLPLAQRLVELMGGHVAVDSAPACGSTFRISVPLEQAEPSSAPNNRASGMAPPVSDTYRALVVEDNPVNQRVAAKLLQKFGFEVDRACNGEEALDQIQEADYRYDVVLMDCQMPVVDGWEASRRIRRRERELNERSVPIIAMTADVLEGTEAACLEAGMDAYLPKPVRRGKLREALQRHLAL